MTHHRIGSRRALPVDRETEPRPTKAEYAMRPPDTILYWLIEAKMDVRQTRCTLSSSERMCVDRQSCGVLYLRGCLMTSSLRELLFKEP